MFSSSSEPESTTSFIFQLPSNSVDVSVCPAKKPKSITSFSNWMEAWNIYLAVCVDHMPFHAPSLIAYQRIITSASIQYPLNLGSVMMCNFKLLQQLARPYNGIFAMRTYGFNV